ncbi:Uncharacterised protein [uncultured archaeon]|nr:Uncharacterised protein [uncultured archaeon]
MLMGAFFPKRIISMIVPVGVRMRIFAVLIACHGLISAATGLKAVLGNIACVAGKKTPDKKPEKGLCVLCGAEKEGAPARKDCAIAVARHLRKALGMPGRHTVACAGCLASCIERRAAFESMLSRYRLYAAAFALVLAAGSAAYGAFTVWIALPALIGAAIIMLLPYGRYFPDFG